ncbi:MAG TPA: hypothetical protein VJT50_02870 [Pyrinomonadaceae bacterium]|nr:hypothetical protein [Pyrinomonadaceae bacterium]
MMTLIGMRRANGDWFAIDDNGQFRVPLFSSVDSAMTARSRESGMECFRPVELDAKALRDLTTTDGGKACYWLVSDPLKKLSRGMAVDRVQLERFISRQSNQSSHGEAK